MLKDAEYRALAEKVKAGTATPEEVDRLHSRLLKTRTFGGAVEITHTRQLTVEEWGNPERILRRNLWHREQAEKRAAEEKERQG